jgi:hypothetical protein
MIALRACSREREHGTLKSEQIILTKHNTATNQNGSAKRK